MGNLALTYWAQGYEYNIVLLAFKPVSSQIRSELIDNLSDLLVLTEIESYPLASRNKLDLRVRADLVSDLVNEYWPDLGAKALEIFKAVTRKALAGVAMAAEVAALHEGEFYIVWDSKRLFVSCYGAQSFSRELLSCLLWLQDCLGQGGNSAGLHRRRGYTIYQIAENDISTRDISTTIQGLNLPSFTQMPATVWVACQHDTDVLKKDMLATDQSCWLELFGKGYIASAPSYTKSKDSVPPGKGLQIPFNLLVSITDVEDIVQYDGGLILAGPRAALIPIKLLDAPTRTVQWHLVVAPTEEPSLSHCNHKFWEPFVPEPRDRYMEIQIEKMNGIAFVAYQNNAKFIWGTPSFERTERNRVRGFRLQKISRPYDSITTGGQFELKAPLSFLTITFSRSVTRNAPADPESNQDKPDYYKDFRQRIDRLCQDTAFVYDVGIQVGWLISAIDLVNLLIRCYSLRRRYGATQFPLNRVVNLRAHQDLQNVLESMENKHLEGHAEPFRTYGKLIEKFYDHYYGRFAKIKYESRKQHNLIGWELEDLLEENVGNEYRVMDVNNCMSAWTPLVGTQNVIFSEGLECPVKPEGSNAACRFIDNPPKGVLICPLFLLHRLLQKKKCTFVMGQVISNHFQWDICADPFLSEHGNIGTSCTHALCWQRVLQQIKVSHNEARGQNRNRTGGASAIALDFNGEGAVCFGKYPEIQGYQFSNPGLHANE